MKKHFKTTLIGPLLKNILQNRSALIQSQQVIISHLLDSQITQIPLTYLPPFLLARSALNQIRNEQQFDLIGSLIFRFNCFEIREVIYKLIADVLILNNRNVLGVESMAFVQGWDVPLLFVVLAAAKSSHVVGPWRQLFGLWIVGDKGVAWFYQPLLELEVPADGLWLAGFVYLYQH